MRTVFPAASEPSSNSYVLTLIILEVPRRFLIKRRQITGRFLDFWLIIKRVLGSPFWKGLLLVGKVWTKTITGFTKLVFLKWLVQGLQRTVPIVIWLKSYRVACPSRWPFCILCLVVTCQWRSFFSFEVQGLTNSSSMVVLLKFSLRVRNFILSIYKANSSILWNQICSFAEKISFISLKLRVNT